MIPTPSPRRVCFPSPPIRVHSRVLTPFLPFGILVLYAQSANQIISRAARTAAVLMEISPVIGSGM